MRPTATRSNRPTFLVATLLVTITAARAAEKPGEYRPRQQYGTDKDVAMLVNLLDDRDPYVRQQALKALGETNNPAAAAEPIGRAFRSDGDTGVRLSALQAAWNLPHPKRQALLREALAAEAPLALQRGALLEVREQRIASVSEAVAALVAGDNAALAADALQTLTALGQAARPAVLVETLSHTSPAVRLRAAENALLLKPHSGGKPLTDALAALTGEKVPGVRAAALTARALHAKTPPREQLLAAWNSKDPRMRSAAVRAWGLLGKPGRVDDALEDKSAMVRLAAIRSAGRLGGVRYMPKLFDRLAEAPIDAHRAAREALLQITPARTVASAAAKWLTDPPGTAKTRSRNLISALWLLSELKSDVAAETRIKMLRSLPIDSAAVAECARGLAAAKIADARKPLRDLLKRNIAQAKRHLSSPSPVPYSQEVTAAAMEAQSEMNATEALPLVIEAGRVKYLTARLGRQSAIAARMAAGLVNEEKTEAVAAFLSDLITDPHQPNAARFHACIAAGELKSKSTSDALRQVLEKDRPSRQVLQAAGWALEEITGQAVEISAPPSNPGRTWILRRMD
ncbi:MAG: HEAT repeat domain-containing protein [Planctomycetota bacterium]